MDDASVLAQDTPGANILLQAIRQFLGLSDSIGLIDPIFRGAGGVD